jgi:hypothetical protein
MKALARIMRAIAPALSLAVFAGACVEVDDRDTLVTGESTGGSTTLDPTCNAGADLICTCLEGSTDPCTPSDQGLLYEGCVEHLAEAEWVRCFGGYSDCSTATNVCIPSDTCDDSCVWADDGECDEPTLCTTGTDCTDCGGL